MKNILIISICCILVITSIAIYIRKTTNRVTQQSGLTAHVDQQFSINTTIETITLEQDLINTTIESIPLEQDSKNNTNEKDEELTIEDYLEKARKFITENKRAEAIECFDKAIDLNPEVWSLKQLYFLKGQQLRVLERYDEALKVLELAISIISDDNSSGIIKEEIEKVITEAKLQNIDLGISDILKEDLSLKGFELLKNESLGFLTIGMKGIDAIHELGEADEKSIAAIQGYDGKEHQKWLYNNAGIELFMVFVDDSQIIENIRINPPCKLVTNRDIGIGSTINEVLDAYTNEVNFKEYSEESTNVIAGTIYGGIIFDLDDKGYVSSIFIGAVAE